MREPQHRLLERQLEVLQLARLLQRLCGRRLDAEEYGGESRLHHRFDQGGQRGQVDARLGVELERAAVLLLPPRDLRQQLGCLAPVADEVVVDHEDRSTPPELVQRIELPQHLRRRLHPGVAAVQLDDVAELALERTAPRALHAHRRVARAVEQIESRRKGGGKIRLGVVRRGQHVRAVLERAHQLIEASFRLAEKNVVGVRELVWARADCRTADHGADPGPPGTVDKIEDRRFVNEHARDQRRVGPAQVVVAQSRDVQIENPEIPAVRQESGECREAEWGVRCAFADDPDRVLESPVRLRREGLHQKHVHEAHSVRRSSWDGHGGADCRGMNGQPLPEAVHPTRYAPPARQPPPSDRRSAAGRSACAPRRRAR